MNVSLTDSTIVLALWWTALGLTVIVIAPLATYLLHRVWRAARMIERYTRETLEAAGGVAAHTEAIAALDETVAAAGPIAEKARRIRDATDTLAGIFRARS